jgi:hypothetical protein
MTWKQQTLVILLTEAGEVAEADLFRWLEHSALPSFRKDVLKQLHKARLIEYDTAARTIKVAAARRYGCRSVGGGNSARREIALHLQALMWRPHNDTGQSQIPSHCHGVYAASFRESRQ